jgi:hypothetical protein
VQGTDPLHTHLGQASLTARPDPAACCHSPLSVYSVHVYSRGSGGRPQPLPRVAGGPGCDGSSLWIFLAMVGVFAVSRSQYPVHERACLLSLLPLWGWS